MKHINFKQTVDEFNEALEDGLENGFILDNKDDVEKIFKLTGNLLYYITYFIAASHGKKES